MCETMSHYSVGEVRHLVAGVHRDKICTASGVSHLTNSFKAPAKGNGVAGVTVESAKWFHCGPPDFENAPFSSLHSVI